VAERWKADCLAIRSESQAMRKERDSLKRQVVTLSNTNVTQLERLTSAQQERDELQKRVDLLESELVALCRDANYRLPDGRLQLEKLACKNEVLWSSPGSLEPREQVTAAQRKESWTVLTDVLRVQWHAMTECWKAIDDHIEHIDPNLDAYEPM
jgi:chromosome segregation ATPase